MRRKEWTLLRRDPWLASQTLTQLLYLVPPALLLSQNFGEQTGSFAVVTMVLVTVGGQLAGALAWLAISGEDAPDLVATAPSAGAVVRAKVEAVLSAIIWSSDPLVVALAFLSPRRIFPPASAFSWHRHRPCVSALVPRPRRAQSPAGGCVIADRNLRRGAGYRNSRELTAAKTGGGRNWQAWAW
jgi:hypothetical protein